MQVGFDVLVDSRWGTPPHDDDEFGRRSENLMGAKYIYSSRFRRHLLVEDLGEYPASWDSPSQCHGDHDDDLDVDTVDWPIFRDGFGSAMPQQRYIDHAAADYDHDGDIDTVDWPIFRDNFGYAVTPDCPTIR